MLITGRAWSTRSKVDEIRIVGRNTQGVRVMNLNEGDKIASIAKVAQRERSAEIDENSPQRRRR